MWPLGWWSRASGLASSCPAVAFLLIHPPRQASVLGKTNPLRWDMSPLNSKTSNPHPFRELSQRAQMSVKTLGTVATPLSLLYSQRFYWAGSKLFVFFNVKIIVCFSTVQSFSCQIGSAENKKLSERAAVPTPLTRVCSVIRRATVGKMTPCRVRAWLHTGQGRGHHTERQ